MELPTYRKIDKENDTSGAVIVDTKYLVNIETFVLLQLVGSCSLKVNTMTI